MPTCFLFIAFAVVARCACGGGGVAAYGGLAGGGINED